MVKITFLGDMMCKREQLALIKNGGHSFAEMFSDVKSLLDSSDFVVGNLETPIAKGKYTDDPSIFNSPVELAKAVKDAGVDMVLTANNHCLDRGIAGLRETINALDSIGLLHSGTYAHKGDEVDPCYVTVKGIRFAFVPATYGTNSEYIREEDPRKPLSDEEEWMVDLLKKPARAGSAVSKRIQPWHQRTKQWIIAKIPRRLYVAYAVLRNGVPRKGIPDTYTADNVQPDEIGVDLNKVVMDRYLNKVRTGKSKADVVVAMPHVGGQYNPAPGSFHRYVIDQTISAGADLVVAGHSHAPMPSQLMNNGSFVVNSLGNFCCTPYIDGFVYHSLSEYSAIFNAYFDEASKRCVEREFVVVKNVVDADGFTRVIPVDNLIADEKIGTLRERLLVEKSAVLSMLRGGGL